MDDETIVESLVSGSLKWYQVEGEVGGDSIRATELRRRALEKMCDVSLEHIGSFSIDANLAMNTNIENMIGALQVPMGVVGPLKINGEYARDTFHVPLATTEGALLASANRGCSIITAAGGATTTILKEGVTRAPVFKVPSARHANTVIRYIESNFEKIKAIAEHGEPFLKLLKIAPYVVGRNLFLRFVYDTSDAMGMNMVTIGTDQAIKLLEEEFGFLEYVSLSGNMCIDKKPAAINLIEGRGKSVVAEVTLSPELISEKLKTTAGAIADVNYRKNIIGSAQAASYGFNAHFANMIAALFLATGQDEAHPVEGSMGFTTAELMPDGSLHVAVTLPALMVGTVGGGTRVETQAEALSILGLAGGGKNQAKAFSEVAASIVLAGELSLLGALSARHLSRAHMQHGRGESPK